MLQVLAEERRDLSNVKLKMENGKLNTLKIFNFQLSIFNSKAAFTLAEVLITLVVIGVVAAITMPMLITNINDRVNFERHANIAYKVTQAMEQMRAHGKLVQYANTNAFVDELQKYLKISKRCDANNIAECWPTETVLDKDGNEFNVSDAKTRKSLLTESTTDDDNVGLILADGASIILTYNKNADPIDIGTAVTAYMKDNPKGQKIAYSTSVTESIDFMTDVNGKKGPNAEGKDVKSFRSAHFAKTGHACDNGSQGCLWLVEAPGYVNCSSSNSESDDYKNYCGDHPSGYSQDYWAGANQVCKQAGMTLPDTGKLHAIWEARSSYTGSNTNIASNTGWFWSSQEDYYDPQHHARFVNFGDGYAYDESKLFPYQVLCLGE